MTYCEQLVEDPHRTIVVLVSDFCERRAAFVDCIVSTLSREWCEIAGASGA